MCKHFLSIICLFITFITFCHINYQEMYRDKRDSIFFKRDNIFFKIRKVNQVWDVTFSILGLYRKCSLVKMSAPKEQVTSRNVSNESTQNKGLQRPLSVQDYIKDYLETSVSVEAEALIQTWRDADLQDKDGRTLLMAAATPLIKWLIAKGATVNVRGNNKWQQSYFTLRGTCAGLKMAHFARW